MTAVSILAFLGNHLWQSTIFAVVAAVLAMVLRENHAQIRYWLWVTASIKFLIPLSLLSGISGHFAPITPAPTMVPPAAFAIVEQWSEPFVQRNDATDVSSISTTRPTWPVAWPILLLAVWLSGCVIVAIASYRRWCHVATWVRQATPLLEGPQACDLQRLQRLHGLSKPISIALSESAREPGLFGIVRPVLVLPADIGNHLDKEQLGAILAHEMCHARRRDNLWAVLHMIVEAAFWFHPIVWWLGSRLVDERERSCDEDVLSRGCEPEVYARAMVKICQLCLASPVKCVSGISGSDLKKRVEAVMKNRIVPKLSLAKKTLLASTGIAAVLIVLLNTSPRVKASQIGAQSRPTETLMFEVASVKPLAPGGWIALPRFNVGGRFTSSVPLSMVIATAYGLPFNTNTPVRQSPTDDLVKVRTSRRLSGVPEWALTVENIYAIEAMGVVPAGLSAQARRDRMRLMLQTLLADRFKLVIHRETKDMPVYALVVAEGGFRLQKADIEEKDCPDPEDPSTSAYDACHILNGDWGIGLHGRAVSISDLVNFVDTDYPLVDKTGLKGLYVIETTPWLPMDGLPLLPGAAAFDGTDMTHLPTIFEVFEKLGLKMERQIGKVDVYVVDHVERPTEN